MTVVDVVRFVLNFMADWTVGMIVWFCGVRQLMGRAARRGDWGTVQVMAAARIIERVYVVVMLVLLAPLLIATGRFHSVVRQTSAAMRPRVYYR